MKPRTALALLACLLLLALAGCGGDDGGSSSSDTKTTEATETTASVPADAPKPSETAEQYGERWAKALETEDCATVASIYGYTQDKQKSCDIVFEQFKGVEVTEARQFGPAGLLFVKASESNAPAMKQGAVVPIAMYGDDQGRFIDTGSIAGITSFKLESAQGDARKVEESKTAVEDYLAALRDRDCDALYDVELTPRGWRKKQQCKTSLTPGIAKAIKDAGDAEPELLGTAGGWNFYGVALGDRYYTVPTYEDTDGGIDAIGLFRAKGTPAD